MRWWQNIRTKINESFPVASQREFSVEALEDRCLLAATARLVAEINPSGASNPANLVDVGGTLFFTATNGSSGVELWKSDGNTATLVKDIRPGSLDSNPQNLVNIGGTLYFSATDGTNGVELWKSNGTAAGTVMVKNINPTGADSSPAYFTNVNGTIFFTANEITRGVELWKTDGTETGTTLVRDLIPGAAGSYPSNLLNFNGTLLFKGMDATTGFELFQSNGSALGTVLLKEIRPGAGSSNPSEMTLVNGTLFFRASNGSGGNELWKSNGTNAGTVLVKDIRTGTYLDSYPKYLTNVNGTLLFQANDGVNGAELWSSNGTAAGTVLVKDICPGAYGSYPHGFASLSGKAYFAANNGTNGVELWSSGLTGATTALVKDILNGGASSSPNNLVAANGALYFFANNGAAGMEPHRSDGTSAGTALLKDIASGAAGSNPMFLTNVATTTPGVSKPFFSASSGAGGAELWLVTAGAPNVTNVAVRGTTWGASLPAYNVPVGSGNQLLALPWTNINQIAITFSDDVAVDMADLTLTGVNVPTYTASSFAYVAATRTATWTLSASIGADKVAVKLDATTAGAIKDLLNNRLDGEWTNPTTTGQATSALFPSGDGVAGGDFRFRINVLPGDANGSLAVSALDINLVRLANTTVFGGAGYNIRNDINASGSVSALDLNLTRLRTSTTIASLSEPLDSFDPTPFFAASSIASSSSLTPSAVRGVDFLMQTPSSISFLGDAEYRGMLEWITKARRMQNSRQIRLSAAGRRGTTR